LADKGDEIYPWPDVPSCTFLFFSQVIFHVPTPEPTLAGGPSARIDKLRRTSKLFESVLYVGARREAAFRTISSDRFSGGIPG